MVWDPTQLNDPLALQVQWAPLTAGGSNLTTHRLRRIDANHVEFRKVIGRSVLRLTLPFCAFAVGLIVWTTHKDPSQARAAWQMLGLFGVGALVAIALLHLFNGRRSHFDLAGGTFLRNPPRGDSTPSMDAVPLAQVRALQLVTIERSDYCSYELNLVLSDASRVAVAAHGGRKVLRIDADELGRLLGIPVWDGTALRG